MVSHPACPADPRSECVLVPSLRERNHGACPLSRLASSCRVRQGSAPCCFCAISYLVRALQVPPPTPFSSVWGAVSKAATERLAHVF